MDNGITVVAAAKELHRSPSTVRRWVQHGCPTERLGAVGRGKGSLLCVEDVRRWKIGDIAPPSDDELLDRLAVSLWDCFKRDDCSGALNIEERKTAGLLVLVYQRYYLNLKKEQLSLDKVPKEIKHLCAIFIE